MPTSPPSANADSGDFGPLGELIARALLDNLNRFIVPSVAGPGRLVPLAALADDDFSVAALRQAAQRAAGSDYPSTASAANWPVFRDYVLRSPSGPLRRQLSDAAILNGDTSRRATALGVMKSTVRHPGPRVASSRRLAQVTLHISLLQGNLHS